MKGTIKYLLGLHSFTHVAKSFNGLGFHEGSRVSQAESLTNSIHYCLFNLGLFGQDHLGRIPLNLHFGDTMQLFNSPASIDSAPRTTNVLISYDSSNFPLCLWTGCIVQLIALAINQHVASLLSVAGR